MADTALGAPAARAARAAAALAEADPPRSLPAYSLVTRDERAAGAPVTVTPAAVGAPTPDEPPEAGTDAADDVAAPEPASEVQAPSATAAASGATRATAVERRRAGRGGRITGPR